jgi:hypothetical protein
VAVTASNSAIAERNIVGFSLRNRSRKPREPEMTWDQLYREYGMLRRQLMEQGGYGALYRKLEDQMPASMTRFVQEDQQCAECGEWFRPRSGRNRFCSLACNDASKRVKHDKSKRGPRR